MDINSSGVTCGAISLTVLFLFNFLRGVTSSKEVLSPAGVGDSKESMESGGEGGGRKEGDSLFFFLFGDGV